MNKEILDTDKLWKVCFAVNQRPFCFWSQNPKADNHIFLLKLDPNYFDSIGKIYYSHLIDDANKNIAALALIQNYHHALETLFALICSLLQAPHCTIGWFHKYENKDLRELVRKISESKPFGLNIWGRDEFSWESIAKICMHPITDSAFSGNVNNFAILWRRFAVDFQDLLQIDEYNSIKHGLRISSGEFKFSIELPAESENNTNKERLTAVSEFGSSFYSLENISGNKQNFKSSLVSRSWNPQSTLRKTQLASMSMQNIISYLRLYCYPGQSVTFSSPSDSREFEVPWNTNTFVQNVKYSIEFDVSHLDLLSRDQIIAEYENIKLKHELLFRKSQSE